MTHERYALVVPVLTNFTGLADLFTAVDLSVLPIVIPNWRRPRSVAASWNEGIRRAAEAKCDVVFVANDDVIPLPGCLQLLSNGLLHRGDLLLTSAFETIDDRGLDQGLCHRARYSLFAVEPKRFLDLAGPFDEGFSPAYYEDDDMKRRLGLLAKQRGVTTVDRRMPGAWCHHNHGTTQHRDPNHPVVSHAQIAANQARYATKWGGPPEHETLEKPALPTLDRTTGAL